MIIIETKQTKITRATFKRFVKLQLEKDNLYIKTTSHFDGMTDCVQQVEDDFHKTKPTTLQNSFENTLGVAGIWLVGHGGDYFSKYEAVINGIEYEGIHVYNCCGTFNVAVKK